MRTTSGFRTGSVIVIAAAAAALSLAGCGGGGNNGSDSATNASSNGSSNGSADAFRTCLKEHGVDLPNFGQGGPGQGQPPANGQPPTGGEGRPSFGNDSKSQKAFNACRDKAPAGGFGGGQNSQAFQAYTSCLRDHGVNVPNPSTSTSTSTGQSTPPPSFDRNDPNFAAANQACQALLPTSSTTTSSTVKS